MQIYDDDYKFALENYKLLKTEDLKYSMIEKPLINHANSNLSPDEGIDLNSISPNSSDQISVNNNHISISFDKNHNNEVKVFKRIPNFNDPDNLTYEDYEYNSIKKTI